MPLLDTASAEEETDAVLRATCDHARREAFATSADLFTLSSTSILEGVFNEFSVSDFSESSTCGEAVDKAGDCPPWITVKLGRA